MGFMSVWLVSEVLQMGLIFIENRKLFEYDPSITFFPVLKLVLVMVVSLPICMVLLHYSMQRSLAMVGAAAAVGIAMLMVESYFVFGLRGVWTEFVRQMRRGASTA
jgi:hypothetical protein